MRGREQKVSGGDVADFVFDAEPALAGGDDMTI
jgi:hypothetical protein